MRRVLNEGKDGGELYKLPMSMEALVAKGVRTQRWHKRLCHLYGKVVLRLSTIKK